MVFQGGNKSQKGLHMGYWVVVSMLGFIKTEVPRELFWVQDGDEWAGVWKLSFLHMTHFEVHLSLRRTG